MTTMLEVFCNAGEDEPGYADVRCCSENLIDCSAAVVAEGVLGVMFRMCVVDSAWSM